MTKIMNTGNTACAMAVKAANVDFIAAYPITPQTTISEKLADYAAAGELKGKYLPVESEHSVMSAVAAASATGARTDVYKRQGRRHEGRLVLYPLYLGIGTCGQRRRGGV